MEKGLTSYVLNYLLSTCFDSKADMARQLDMSKRALQRVMNEPQLSKGGSVALVKALCYCARHHVPVDPILREYAARDTDEQKDLILRPQYRQSRSLHPPDPSHAGAFDRRGRGGVRIHAPLSTAGLGAHLPELHGLVQPMGRNGTIYGRQLLPCADGAVYLPGGRLIIHRKLEQAMIYETDLFSFSFVPNWYLQLDALAELALPEPWRFRSGSYSEKNYDTPILERYIQSIFANRSSTTMLQLTWLRRTGSSSCATNTPAFIPAFIQSDINPSMPASAEIKNWILY
ncbi:MAG: hypothetical protein ACLS3C_12120 [Oscillospiraceae bacterium]